jgi:type I restriction enzyme R subunit
MAPASPSSSGAYSELTLVEAPAIELFSELGWTTVSADTPAGDDAALGRASNKEAMLGLRLHAALARLNPRLPAMALDAAVEEATHDRTGMGLAAANRELWALLRDGVTVQVPDQAHGGHKTERVRLVDWDTPANNDFLLVSQFTIKGPLYTCRPDLVAFVNGLPWVVIELKKPGVPAKQGFDGNLTSYKHPLNGVQSLFWANALLIASNGTDSRVGSLTADWERFVEWKRIAREDEPRRVSLDVMLRGLCDPARLLDLAENFTLFSEHKAGLVKVLAQNHQFLGVNNAIRAMLKARYEGHGRGGVFWQTQGSGKSFSMVFFAQKVMRKLPGNWSFVVVTDRVELDEQIARTFAACGAVNDATDCHAGSGAHLRELLAGNNRYVFTLIHKFQGPEVLCDRRDVIVLTDEAHRSQYDTLALNMRAALPNATFVAFTGTPLIVGEERTREVFGDYVSIYDFQQSIEDGATVPLFYENRTPALQLDNPDFGDQMQALIDEADLSEEAGKKLERALGRQYELLTRDSRLDVIAQDIVRHFSGRGFQGKAMMVSIDKATALRMLNKVRAAWTEEQARVARELRSAKLTDSSRAELVQQLAAMDGIDMALIVSPGQNEIEEMAAKGLDIVPHRERMNREKLDEKFKDPADPLKLVFVCAMWLTGFDAPSVSTIYLDKPMRNHTLMQTIARANRVYPGKQSGMIVDYANVFAALEKALAIYGQGQNGAMPVRDKQELADELKVAVEGATAFCAAHGVDLSAIEATPTAHFKQAGAIGKAADTLMAPEAVQKDFLAHAGLVDALYRAVKPDPAAIAFSVRCGCLTAIAQQIKSVAEPADISQVMAGIEALLDDSIAAEPFRIGEPDGQFGIIDLSKINFQALRQRFDKTKEKPTATDVERLKAAVKMVLERMVRQNPTRADYLEKFQKLIDSYNAGSRQIEDIFAELVALSQVLTEEQSRHVRENVNEEELAILDILTKPAPELTPEERAEVKKVARQLLARVHELVVLGWRQKVAARARVAEAIKDVLDEGLPRAYDKPLYESKCAAVFDHVFQAFGDGGIAAAG